MQKEEVSGGHPFKMRAFATAIKTIHELDYRISESTHVKDLPGVGEGISRRIMDFIGARRKKDFRNLKPLDIEEQKKSLAMQELQRINGIGPIKARALVEGHTSLA
ncbi:hypothetical protein JB92DRAFT_119918 [Gautieria morchelliformis]|nr:hypothetical protein JB92DRAFT_119918 [Gautieria morchelliformis]